MRPDLLRCGVEVRGFEPLASSVRETIRSSADLGERSESVADLGGGPTATIRSCPWLSGLLRPKCGPQVVSCPVGLRSVADSLSNLCSIPWFGGYLARPGAGPADRGAAGAVRGAARRRPGQPQRGRGQGRALPPRRRHQDLEPHAAGTPAAATGVWAAAATWTAAEPRPPMPSQPTLGGRPRSPVDQDHLILVGGRWMPVSNLAFTTARRRPSGLRWSGCGTVGW
jgi:hypothetical protein